jgi:chromosome segregation ATPase
MPLGLWKSKWEIHREMMNRHREESDRRHAEHREDMARRREESDRRHAEHEEKMERWAEETSELREKYDRELAATRRLNRKMLARFDTTSANLQTTLGLLGDEIIAMRGDIHDLKGSVDAQTEAIMKLVDRFEASDGPPV